MLCVRSQSVAQDSLFCVRESAVHAVNLTVLSSPVSDQTVETWKLLFVMEIAVLPVLMIVDLFAVVSLNPARKEKRQSFQQENAVLAAGRYVVMSHALPLIAGVTISLSSQKVNLVPNVLKMNSAPGSFVHLLCVSQDT